MPIEMKIWKLEGQPRALPFEALESESKLEQLLTREITIISPQLFLIGSQVATAHGKFIDLLAIDDEANIVVVELKRDKTPRDAVAQLLDYGSWAKNLSYADLENIYSEKNQGGMLGKAYAEATGLTAPEELSGQLELLLVASMLDPESERIMNFLSGDYGVPINAAFFRYFKDGSNEYLTRSWLLDPSAVEANSEKSRANRTRESWNGEDFYVAFGEDQHRNWEDARQFGFISAGGGSRYSQRLANLFEDARVFVCIPKHGYVGVGLVIGPMMPARDFQVEKDGKRVPILDAGLRGKYLADHADDSEMAEYFVPVEWLKQVSTDKAFWKPGMYANQNIVTKLRNQTTLQLLKEHFGL